MRRGHYEDDESEDSGAPIFVAALRSSLGRAALWTTTGLVTIVLALVPALPWFQAWSELLGQRYEPGSQVATLDPTLLFDHRELLGGLETATARGGAVVAFLALLCGILFAGGWLQVLLERTRGQSIRRFAFGGTRYFWRFLRVALLALLALALLQWVVYGWPWRAGVLGGLAGLPPGERGALEGLDSERSVRWLGWVQDGLFGLGFLLVLVLATYARTALALQERRSALLALARAVGFVAVHPLASLGPMLALGIVELAVLVPLAGGLAAWIDGGFGPESGALRVALLFLVAQLALLWREITRGARYSAAIRVLRAHAPAHWREDPWQAIGGPGGPQYPVGEVADEYGVSL